MNTEIVKDKMINLQNECRVCRNVKNNTEYKVSEHMYGTGDSFLYFECASCGCLQISQTPENLSIYYPSEYYSYQSPKRGFKGQILHLVNALRDDYALRGKGLLGKIAYSKFPRPSLTPARKFGVSKQSKILDVGCGSADMLHGLSLLGYSNLHGVDPFLDEDIHYKTGLSVKKQFIHEVDGVGTWDVIILSHSFEHMDNPSEVMESVARLLRPDGVCVLAIPVADSYAWEKYRENWAALDAPRHLFLHSQKSIKVIAEQSGLSVVDVTFDSSSFQFWGSELCLKGVSFGGVNPHDYFSEQEILDFERKSEDLNTQKKGEACTFILQKNVELPTL